MRRIFNNLKVDGNITTDGNVVINPEGKLSDGTNNFTLPDQTGTLIVDADLGTAASKNTGTASGNVPVLDSNGKLVESIIPAVAITDTYEAASQAAMLALSAQKGDICIRSDLNKSFVLSATPASTLANWKELKTPTDAVLSVNGQTGAVVLDAADVGAATSTHKHSYTPAGTVSLGSNDTASGGVAYVASVSGTAASGTPTTKYLHKSTTNAAPNAHTHTVTVSGTTGANSGTAVSAITGYPDFSGGSLGGTKTFVTGVSGGSGKLEAYDAATGGTKKVSDGTRIPYVAAQGTITGASYTPAGSVTLTAGTAPSMGAATTKYLSAAPSHTSTTSGNNSGTKVVAVTGYPNFSGGSLTGTKTFVTGVSGGSGKLESYDAATSGTKKVSDGTRIGYISSLNTTKLSASFTGSAVTSAANSGTKVTAVTGYPNFSGGSLGGTKTFITGVSGGSGSLESNTTASGGIKYLEAVSFENGILTLETKYLHHTHTAASASGTGTVTLTAASLGSPSTGDCAPNAHTHSVTAAGSVSLSTGDSGTTIATGGTTWYLAHSHTGASSSGTGTVGFTAASLGDPSTGDAAPHTHTHSYDKTTGITLTANAETATGRITYIQAQGTFTAGTTPKASASFSGTAATITPTLSAATTYYLEHGHTAASSSGTGTVTLTAASLGTPSTSSVAPAAHTHSYGSSTALTTSENSGSAVAAITGLAANTSSASGDITFLESYSVSGGTVSGTTKYFHPSFSGTTKDTGEPKQ